MTALIIAEDVVKNQVPPERPVEIERYLSLFGYKPEESMLEVHLASSFAKKNPALTMVGTTHDPVLGFRLLHPESKPRRVDSGYLGYLFAPKDEERRPPHDLLPLDFTPWGITYPQDWETIFGSEGFVIAMQVPSSLASSKDILYTTLRRIGGAIDVKNRWEFLNELYELPGSPS